MGINSLVMALTGSETSSITLPDYIGAMFVSVLVRNLNEKFHWFNYNAKFCDGLVSDIFSSNCGAVVSRQYASSSPQHKCDIFFGR